MISLPTRAVDNVRMKIAGPEVEQLRRIAILLDQLSYRPMPAFDSWGGFDLAMPGATPSGDYRVWWGGGLYRTGMTSLVITGKASGYGSAFLNVYLNNALNTTITLGSTFTKTIDISTGYSDGDVIEVEIITSGNTVKTGQIRISSVYTTPITLADSWPGVPTFGTSFLAAKYNQLLDACDWLFRRINAVPVPLQVSQMYAPMSYKVGEWVRYWGFITKHHTQDILRIVGTQFTLNPSERLRVYFDGALAHNHTTYASGATNAIYLPLDLSSYSVGAQIEVKIVNQILTSNFDTYPVDTDPRKRIHSRLNLLAVRTEAGGSGYPVASPPAASSAGESVAQGSLTSRLNAIASMLSAIKSRIDANPALWNRAYAMRKRYGGDAKEVSKAIPTYPHAGIRFGGRLIFRGQGATLNHGATELEVNDGIPSYDKIKYAHTKTLTEGDKTQTVQVALDDIPGLTQGASFRITGNTIIYAAQVWE